MKKQNFKNILNEWNKKNYILRAWSVNDSKNIYTEYNFFKIEDIKQFKNFILRNTKKGDYDYFVKIEVDDKITY